MSARVVIAGAGVLGLATAHALVEAGVRDVVVLERAAPGAGATGRSGALVRSNYDNPVEARLAAHSLAFYRDFARLMGGSPVFSPVGLLVMVAPERAEAMARLAALQRSWGVDIEAVDARAARERAPRLRVEDAGLVLHQPDAGCCDANAVLAGYLRRLAEAGVDIRLSRPARAPILRGGRAVGFETDEGPVEGDAIVVAAGVWSNALLPPGLDLGLEPRLTRVASFRPLEFTRPDHPTIIDTIQEAWFRPLGAGTVLVGSETGVVPGVDPEAVPSSAPDEIVERYRSVLARRFAVSPHAAPRGAWAGAFMLSPDHRPVVGPAPGIPGLHLMTGDSGGAFKTAPALGLGLAQTILSGAATSVDLAGLSPDRLLARARPSPARRATVSR